MDFETIIWLVFAVIWFVFSAANNKRKKEAEQRKKANLPPQPDNKPRSENPVEEVLRELRRAAESGERKMQNSPKPVMVKTVREAKRQTPIKQELITGKDVISVAERKKAMEYEAFVRNQRRTEHDADNRHLEEQIQNFYTEDDNVQRPDISLRDIIIADVILNRPYQ